jgi:SH3-like domain-containing protein
MSVFARSTRVAAASFILATGFSVRHSPPAAAETWRVVDVDAEGRVHMRQHPSNRSKILAYIPGDMRGLLGHKCAGNWCEIEYQGQRGWVFRKYLAPDKEMAADAQPVAKPATSVSPKNADPRIEAFAQRKPLRIANSDGRPIPVYAFPNEALPVAGHLAPETASVDGLGSCIRDWCYIRADTLIGWLRMDYFVPDPDAPVNVKTITIVPPAPSSPPANETALRDAAPPSSNTLPTATSSIPLTEKTALAAPQPTADPDAKLYVLAGLAGGTSLPMREKPEDDARILASIPPDATNIAGLRKCVEKWCLVRWENASGWVARRHLADPSLDAAQTYQVTGLPLWDTLDIMDYPGDKASVVAEIPASATGLVPIGNCDKSWCQIRYLGIAGWVSARYIEPQKR